MTRRTTGTTVTVGRVVTGMRPSAHARGRTPKRNPVWVDRSDLWARPVVPGCAVTIGELVTVHEIVRKAKVDKLAPRIAEWLVAGWLRGGWANARADAADPILLLREHTRLLAEGIALRRVIANVDKTGMPARFTDAEREAAMARRDALLELCREEAAVAG